MWVICSWFEQIARIKRAIHSKKLYFLYFFLQLFPFLTVCLRALHSCCSPLVRSLVNSDLIDLLLWLFTKEQPEQFAQVTHDRRATMSDSLRLLMIMTKEWRERFAFFSWANGSFAHKKWANQKTDEQIPNPDYLRHKKNLGVCTKMMWKDAAAPVLLSLD